VDNKIDQFISDINSINHENVKNVLSKIYTEDILFIDPVKSITGLQQLTQYFEDLYLNVSACRFTLKNTTPNGRFHSIEWLMHINHRKLLKNNTIELDGASFIEFKDKKVCYHRDYYDLGALIYENIPVLGSVVKKVRHAL